MGLVLSSTSFKMACATFTVHGFGLNTNGTWLYLKTTPNTRLKMICCFQHCAVATLHGFDWQNSSFIATLMYMFCYIFQGEPWTREVGPQWHIRDHSGHGGDIAQPAATVASGWVVGWVGASLAPQNGLNSWLTSQMNECKTTSCHQRAQFTELNWTVVPTFAAYQNKRFVNIIHVHFVKLGIITTL